MKNICLFCRTIQIACVINRFYAILDVWKVSTKNYIIGTQIFLGIVSAGRTRFYIADAFARKFLRLVIWRLARGY